MRKQLLLDYETDQIVELIRQRIHNEDYQRMLYYRLVKGWTFDRIAEKMETTSKTVRRHVHECEEILYRHL